MAHRYDVSLKELFLREGDGILRRLLLGGKVTEHLATEQPQVMNRRADLVARTEDGAIHHLEFQTSNEAGFVARMLEYYAYLSRIHKQHIVQTVLYLGREPLRMESSFKSPTVDFRFDIVNLRELDAAPLLASADWADNVLALLARGDPAEALAVLMSRLRGMASAEQDQAAATIVLLSGILGIEDTVSGKLREVGMINVMENKILGPMMQQQFDKGHSEGEQKGKREGRQEGQQDLLQEMLTEKFGALPVWVLRRLQGASAEDLHAWARRVLHSTTLEDTLRQAGAASPD